MREMVLGMIFGAIASIANADSVSSIEQQVNAGNYSVVCTGNIYGTVQVDDGAYCGSASDGRADCRPNWGIESAAQFVCSGEGSTSATSEIVTIGNSILDLYNSGAIASDSGATDSQVDISISGDCLYTQSDYSPSSGFRFTESVPLGRVGSIAIESYGIFLRCEGRSECVQYTNSNGDNRRSNYIGTIAMVDNRSNREIASHLDRLVSICR